MKSVQSVFIRFLLWFCALGGGTLGICVLLYLSLFAGGVLLPANYGENGFESNRELIQEAEKVTEEMIPAGCTFGVYSLDGEFLYGNSEESKRTQIWQAYKTGSGGGKNIGFLKSFPRDEEVCIGEYQLKLIFASAGLRARNVSPGFLGAIFLILFLIEAVFLVWKFSKTIRDELQNVKMVTERVREQELGFEKPKTRLREVNEVMDSLVQMETALEISLKTQWKMEEERRRQVSALVHDIKTPLTIIRGNTQLMQESNSEEESREYQAYILRETERIEKYIQILQEMLRSETTLEVKNEIVNMGELVKEFVEQAHIVSSMGEKKVEVTIQNIPDFIKSNKAMLQRALENLLSNALEFTPRDKVILLTIKGEAQKFVFQIEDSGPGFTQEDLRHATEQFYQGDKSRNSKNHYGMGLFMVQSFVEQHAGTLQLGNSEKTKGGCVRMELPIN